LQGKLIPQRILDKIEYLKNVIALEEEQIPAATTDAVQVVEYQLHSKFVSLSLTAGTVTVNKKVGYGTLSYVFNAGVLTITSTGEFSSSTFIDTNQPGVTAYEWIDVNTITVTPAVGYGTLGIRIYQDN